MSGLPQAAFLMATPRDNIDALTGLRFVAAFTIALGHYYQPWLEVSGIGMPLFFTLSGFAMQRALQPAGDRRRKNLPSPASHVSIRFT